MKRDTDELRAALMRADSISAYMAENEDCFADERVTQLIADAFRGKGLSKAELARRAGCSTVYVHQVFSGRRCPSRDKTLCLCVGMGASMDETQHLLKAAGYAALYPASRRDSVIIFGLAHGYTLAEIDEKLYACKLDTLT